MRKQLRGSALLLLATVIWGSAFVSQEIAMEHLGPFTFQACRCFVALTGLILIIAIFDRRNKNGIGFFRRWADPTLWKAGLLCGVPLFLACNLQQLGLAGDTGAGKSGFLTAMYIVIVPIIGIFRRKKPSVMVPVSVCLAVIGLYFLSCMGVTSIRLGDILTLGCALAFAFQITIVDIYAARVDALRLNAIQILVCTVLSAAAMLFTESPTWAGIRACVIPFAHTGLLSMGIAYSLQIIGQKDLPPAPAALIMSLESVFALVFGILILKEALTGWEILGCTLVFIAVILSQIPIPKMKK